MRFLQPLRVVNTLLLLVDIAMSGTPPLDLSRAAKLKDLSYTCGGSDIQRVTMALQTVQSKNLQQINIYPCKTLRDLQQTNIHLYGTPENPVEEAILQQWQDLTLDSPKNHV